MLSVGTERLMRQAVSQPLLNITKAERERAWKHQQSWMDISKLEVGVQLTFNLIALKDEPTPAFQIWKIDSRDFSR